MSLFVFISVVVLVISTYLKRLSMDPSSQGIESANQTLKSAKQNGEVVAPIEFVFTPKQCNLAQYLNQTATSGPLHIVEKLNTSPKQAKILFSQSCSKSYKETLLQQGQYHLFQVSFSLFFWFQWLHR